MALVVFLRGANIGGHRTFRPSALARELSAFDVVNVGAAGTFVVWKPGSRAKFLAELLRKLPFESDVALCDGKDLLRLISDNPFGSKPPGPGVVRFVSVLTGSSRERPVMPIAFPSDADWLVRLAGFRGRFVFGEYRRHMKTIGYLGRIDKLFDSKLTTRNWTTILTIVRILENRERPRRD